ncbi:signal recognition particle receptor subunit beta [Neocloeon triangulifer]|uniref:signal recognition particle receptor subunit beta n=1 Tax=Neocloeon triangulifer TaxID=2078957 RepID=UPI00286FAD4C|nr:signal recognition particle receptor subunit beta [Neocloeon triangulifer]XP_059489362.1 signal recognition particle receptor subunit beta [Neocloeon triangulifer]
MAISPQILSILVAIVVIILTAALVFWQRRRASRSGILMVGLNDSGKTLLFSHLVHNKFVDTYTSVKENIGDFANNKATLKIIDIPGHERVRGKFFDQHKQNARGIAFIVDSSTLQSNIRDVAEYLYSLLTDQVVASSSPWFLIVCNKQDQTMAKGSSAVKKLLEKELNTLRKTKHNRLANLDNSAEKVISLGGEDKDFEFEQLNKIRVNFAETSLFNSASKDSIDYKQVEIWLENIAG